MSMGMVQSMLNMECLEKSKEKGTEIVFVDPKSDWWPKGLTIGKLGEGTRKEVTKVAVSRRNEPSL